MSELISYGEAAAAVNAVVIPGATLSKRGMRLDEGLTREDFLHQVLPAVTQIQDCILFWLGDLLIESEDKRKWGEMYKDSKELSKYAETTLTNAKWVCGRIEFSRRRENLPWSHHQEVANVEDPEKQEYWLARCVDEKLSVQALRTEMRKEKEGAQADRQPVPPLANCQEIKNIEDLTTWVEKQDPHTWPPSRCAAMAERLDPIVKFRSKLLDIYTGVPAELPQ